MKVVSFVKKEFVELTVQAVGTETQASCEK